MLLNSQKSYTVVNLCTIWMIYNFSGIPTMQHRLYLAFEPNVSSSLGYCSLQHKAYLLHSKIYSSLLHKTYLRTVSVYEKECVREEYPRYCSLGTDWTVNKVLNFPVTSWINKPIPSTLPMPTLQIFKFQRYFIPVRYLT